MIRLSLASLVLTALLLAPLAAEVPGPGKASTDPKAVGNPLVTARPIVFVVRAQYPGDHHNTATMFQTGEINAECMAELVPVSLAENLCKTGITDD